MKRQQKEWRGLVSDRILQVQNASRQGQLTRDVTCVVTQGPTLGLMLCCRHLEILNDFTFDLCLVSEV